jgi:DNA repair protein RadC
LSVKYATTDRLSDVELVATILGRRAGDEAVTRLATVLTVDGWTGGAPLAEVAREYGSVGPRSLAKLECAIELGRRTLTARAARRAATISTPEDAVALVKPMLVGRNREHFLAIALSTRNSVLRVIEVSIGSLNASIVHPRELFKECVMVSAASVVILHNHPSGNGDGAGATPSGADLSLTRRLVKAGDVLGIEVLDHIVLCGDEFVSLRDSGQM